MLGPTNGPQNVDQVHGASIFQLFRALLIVYQSEFHRRVEQASAGILDTMSWFLRRASLHIVNQSSIPTLVKKLRLADQPNSESQALVSMAGDDGRY